MLTSFYASKGEKGIVEPTFIYLPGIDGGEEVIKSTSLDFFAVPVELGKNGASKAQNPLTSLTTDEKALLETALKGLGDNITKGIAFVAVEPGAVEPGAEAAKL